MPLTPADVHNVAFSKPPIGKRGYNEDEVDAFLDLVENELSRLIEENADLRQRVSELDSELAGARAGTGIQATQAIPLYQADPEPELEPELEPEPVPVPVPVYEAPVAVAPVAPVSDEIHVKAARVLALAQDTADRLTSSAQAESDKLVSDARANAEALVIKGILDPEDAKDAVRFGADGIIVSNHGGRQLDGVLSSARALPAIADAVKGQIKILADSGIRNGLDVVRAIALGADCAMIGRAYICRARPKRLAAGRRCSHRASMRGATTRWC